MPTQAAINSKLADEVNGPILAAFISFAVGTLALFIYILVYRRTSEQFRAVKKCVADFVDRRISWSFFLFASSVVLVPKLGVALTFSLMIAGQMLITLVLDHYGFLGIPVKEVSIQRILGVLLIVGGAILIRKILKGSNHHVRACSFTVIFHLSNRLKKLFWH